MKRSCLILIVVIFLFGGCKKLSMGSDKLSVTVSIPPQAYIVKRIAGEHVDVNVMLPPSASPATYEPGPEKIIGVGKSKYYFTIGLPFESTFIDRLKAEFKDLIFVKMHEGIKLREFKHHGHDGHDHGLNDPHVWLDPINLMQMAENTFKVLIKADPDNSEMYMKNYVKLRDELGMLHDKFLDMFKDSARKYFVVYHPSWGYFADRFGLFQVPVEVEGKEPTAAQMGKLIDLIKKSYVKSIFVQKQFPTSIMESVSKSSGAEIKVLDPMEEDVIINLDKVAKEIQRGLFHAVPDQFK